jgi:4-hydroxy-3-methylbut-2-enyl diphosphate reductase
VTAGLLALAPLRLEARAVAAGVRSATVERTGMGPRRSRSSVARLQAGPAHWAAVAVTGVAGALVEGMAPGDLVVADRVIDTAGREIARLATAPLLARALRRTRRPVHVGTVVSTGAIVRGDAARRDLARLGAIAVDMESASLLGRPWGVPAAVVRTVSDRPGQELVSPSTVTGGMAALRALRDVGPALEAWSAAAGGRQVLLAAPRSFCAGVERAIATVDAALDRFGPPVFVRRHIVHNEHVVADLEARGAVFVRELDEVPAGATVVLSAHGVAPAVRAEAAGRDLRVVDGTCPLVAKVHAEVRRFARDGRTVILVGHAGHDEIDGTLGEAVDIHLVATPADVGRLDIDPATPVAYATQTTLAPADIEATLAALRARFDDLVGPGASDICYATHNRQEALAAIAAECDLVVVVGSDTSSNCRRLVEVAGRAGARAELVADESGLDLAWLAPARRIGVTAGASTPEPLVERVLAVLAGLGPLDRVERPLRHETVSFPLPSEVR